MLEETWLKELSAFNSDYKTVTHLKYKRYFTVESSFKSENKSLSKIIREVL